MLLTIVCWRLARRWQRSDCWVRMVSLRTLTFKFNVGRFFSSSWKSLGQPPTKCSPQIRSLPVNSHSQPLPTARLHAPLLWRFVLGNRKKDKRLPFNFWFAQPTTQQLTGMFTHMNILTQLVIRVARRQNSVKTKSQAYYSNGIWTLDLCDSRAVSYQLDHWDCPVARGSSNPLL